MGLAIVHLRDELFTDGDGYLTCIRDAHGAVFISVILASLVEPEGGRVTTT